MSISGAMNAATSGLKAQSYALNNISGNIANSQTIGFKRVETSFVDFVPELPRGQEVSGSVGAFSRLTNTLQGDIQATGIPTNVAVSGSAFFTVRERTGASESGQPIFNLTDFYTRRGDFKVDETGYLVNGAGYYLQGTSISPQTGLPTGDSARPIQIPSEQTPAQGTTQVRYRANLPSNPQTANADPLVARSEMLQAAGFTADPIATGTVVHEDRSRFVSQTLDGGSVTVYNSVGAPATLQLRWGKTASVAHGDPTDTWQLFYQENGNTTAAGQVAWRSVGTNITFNSSGAMTSATPLTVTGLTINNQSIGNVLLDFGNATGLTQFSASSGLVQASVMEQDGFGSGTLDGVSVSGDGRLIGSYSNGRQLTIANLSMATFPNPDGLKQESGAAYSVTPESGGAAAGLNGSTLVGGNVEASNVDIAQEFSRMIVTQQAYSANTRTITVAQQMYQDLVNIVR